MTFLPSSSITKELVGIHVYDMLKPPRITLTILTLEHKDLDDLINDHKYDSEK